jgi:uncharacterized protein YjbI with pentapeptide repeats
VDLSGADLSGVNAFYSQLTNANFAGALVAGSRLGFTTDKGLRKEQLYATASYQAKDLRRIDLSQNSLIDWDFRDQNLTSANFSNSTLTSVDFTGADLTSAHFSSSTLTSVNFAGADLTDAILYALTLTDVNFAGAEITGAGFFGPAGFTMEQLYSTASYQRRDLQRVGIAGHDLSSWDFSGQNLSGASIYASRLAGANFTGAVIRGASFSQGFTKEQLYATASYQARTCEGLASRASTFANGILAARIFRGPT